MINLIIDANNILNVTFFGHLKENKEVLVGMCHHTALMTMNKYFKQFPCDRIIMAFDSYSWRKLYTKNLDSCVTYKKYKGNRRNGLSPSELEKLKIFDEHVEEFSEMMKNNTSILVLKGKYLEADDLIAGFIQNNPNDQHILISSDKDFKQLLVKNNLTLIDPITGKPRNLDDYDNDPDYFMFEKNFRGDNSDNVMSAYPRLRSDKIKKAYSDPFTKENIINHEFTVLDNDKETNSVIERKFLCKDVFEENNLLMNLEAQPPYIRKCITETIENAIVNIGKFNYPKFLRFCGKNDLKNIIANIDNIVPMLAAKKRVT